MRILIYSQHPDPGGSLRLLLNLARHLAPRHRVVVALDRTDRPGQSDLFRAYPEVNVQPVAQLAEREQSFDVSVNHLPFSDHIPPLPPAKRQIAVTMELTARHAPTLTPANAGRFDAIGYLHPTQVAPLAGSPFASRCVLLPLINNITFEPAFAVTGRVAAIGYGRKTAVADLLRVIGATRRRFPLDIYAGKRPRHAPSFGGGLRLRWYYLTGRLNYRGIQADTPTLMNAFDCLLHLPAIGNGTSTIVSDALHCGKTVVLSPLPDYRRAYSRLEGVHFIDDLCYDLSPVLDQCSISRQRSIRAAYQRTYDRAAALREWETMITGAT